jgi:hypothetical protein
MGTTDGRKFGEVKIVSSCSRAMDGALLLSRGLWTARRSDDDT